MVVQLATNTVQMVSLLKVEILNGFIWSITKRVKFQKHRFMLNNCLLYSTFNCCAPANLCHFLVTSLKPKRNNFVMLCFLSKISICSYLEEYHFLSSLIGGDVDNSYLTIPKVDVGREKRGGRSGAGEKNGDNN